MSDKTQLRWVGTQDIYVPHELNNRSLDAGYVESLEDSMRTQGYLPTYPIICYRRMEMPKEVFDGKTDALYICAAGFHRTTAAKNINLDRVYVDIRRGTFEDYLETLNTDNFQFDPEVDTSLGQIWTKTEKRKACKQLLLLPKYFKLTNIALADLWHTSEANVRRWRDAVASSIDEGSLDAPFPISEEWNQQLKAILDSNVREMADGSTVKIRSKPEESTWDYRMALMKKVDAHETLDWNTEIEPYCEKIYEKDADRLSLKQLAELDQLISVNDPDFMKMCQMLGKEKRARNAAQEKCHAALRAVKKAFDAYLESQGLIDGGYMSTSNDKYNKLKTAFGRAVSKRFGKNLMGSYLYTDTVSKYENETECLAQLQKDIEGSVDYVQAYARRQSNAQYKKRSQLEQAVVDAHGPMLKAVQEKYPGIDLEKFCFAVDSDTYWLKTGDTPATFMHSTADIPKRKSDGDLIRIAEQYKKMLETIEKGADWIAKLVPEKLPLQDALDEMKQRKTDENSPRRIFTVNSAIDLHSVPLNDIFEHVTERVIHLDLDEFEEVCAISQISKILKEVCRGQVGSQLHLLSKIAMLISAESSTSTEVSTEDQAEDRTVESVKGNLEYLLDKVMPDFQSSLWEHISGDIHDTYIQYEEGPSDREILAILLHCAHGHVSEMDEAFISELAEASHHDDSDRDGETHEGTSSVSPRTSAEAGD